ncbi:flagellar basal body-associated FliL family protein [Roseovarius nitratireducens]|uniref:flagellar basal body-associated FliL family protein n=1 Tax=Roseovarius nitratireducens TaxID=2044597 RepID=UPI000CE17399|nr:flagellar basal body-associated FliL family protein [Roseovarius nitratireducens]
MAEAEETGEAADRAAPSRLPLVIGLVLALVGGGGGFYAAWAGLLPFGPVTNGQQNAAVGGGEEAASPAEAVVDFGHLVYVPIEPLVISFADGGRSRHLRFRAELEVPTEEAAEVTRVMPRIVDVLNTYLRALRIADLEESAALPRLRAQMLRRVQAVVGAPRVNDLLVMEFVLN